MPAGHHHLVQDVSPQLYTIGHSNRSFDELRALLDRHGIELVVDVRAFPGSRRQPQFGQDALHDALVEHGIGYRHLRTLGGRRRLNPDAPADWGDAWRHTSFRAYAQHVQTPAFRHGVDELVDLATTARTAIMCSEAVPWRCHRWLVADALTARGVEVLHVLDDGPLRRHQPSSFACLHGDGTVTWPGPASSEPLRLGPRVTADAAS